LLKLNVHESKMKAVIEVLPGMKSPTVSHLYGTDYFAVEAVATEAVAEAVAEVAPPAEAEAAAETVAEKAEPEAVAVGQAPLTPPLMPVIEIGEEEEEETDADARTPGKKKKKKGKRKDRVLVFNEELGETIAIKERKRKAGEWSDEEF